MNSPMASSQENQKQEMAKRWWNLFKSKIQKPLVSGQYASSTPINAVYYPNWRVYRQQPPSSMNLNYITHIFYAFAWLICRLSTADLC